jgi:hypothetical protein
LNDYLNFIAGCNMADELFWAEVGVKAAFAGFLICMGLLAIRNSRQKEQEQRYFLVGIAVFAFMSSLTRIFFLITDFQVEFSGIYDLFWRLATIASLAALILIAILIETYFVKTRYIFTVIAALGVVAIIFADIALARQLLMPFYLIIGVEIFSLYVYVAIKSPGTIRTKALLMIVSLFVFTLGIILDAESIMQPLVGFDIGIIGAICMWIGLGLYLKLNLQELK